MKFYLVPLLIALLASCQISEPRHTCEENKGSSPNTTAIPDHHSSTVDGQIQGEVKGIVITQDSREPIPFAQVALKSSGDLKVGTTTDIDGRFHMKGIKPGSYMLEVMSIGYDTPSMEIEIKEGQIIVLDKAIVMQDQAVDLKPIIYLYPEETMEIQVKLDYDGKLTTTYPSYNSGWTVKAEPDGTLHDLSGREYYALYWEGNPTTSLQIENGAIVAKAETVEFLESSLETLGLNEKEANEFIVFWLPILEKNEFNLIHFAHSDYEERAKLIVNPAPETIIRVMMVFQPLDQPIDITPQDLSKLAKKRKGFTVVEWGGQPLPKSYPIDL